jgi:predicted PurR-regulated permease PerM
VAPPLTDNRVVRAGVVAWSLVGLAAVLLILGSVVSELRLVVVPLLIALFPAALLTPVSGWLRNRGMPPAAAAAVVLVGFLVALVGVLGTIGWLVADELGQVLDTMEEAYDDIRSWADDTVGLTLPEIDELVETVREWARGEDGLGARAPSAAAATIEVVASLLFGIVALFFYLKDGARIAGWLRDLFPQRAQPHVAEVGDRVWFTLGAYFRGQLVVAAVDAVFIGLGLVLLGVPLALPLAVLIFFGGLFPIVGAFTAGALAVLVALADGGIGIALAVLVLNIVVQQVEGNVLEPLIVGRATQLHPLAVIVALTAGAVTLGILGAFLAVPLAASIARAVGYVRTDVRDPVVDELDDAREPEEVEAELEASD